MSKSKLFKKTTLKDIALDTGFSINTVSHALNDQDDISRATKELIMESARRLEYIPNSTAVSMRSGKTHTIAVIMPDISSLYFPIMIKLLEKELVKRKYNIIIMNTNEKAEKEMDCVISAISKNVDGVIICPCQQNTEALDLMERNNIPFVLMGRYFQDVCYESVVMDDVQCGYEATKYLIRKGHRKILYACAPLFISSASERKQGYEKALREVGIPLDESLVREGISCAGYEKIAEDIAQHRLDCTAIFSFSDMMAWGIVNRLLKKGIRVPEDISVIGVDNLESHIILPFELTTVDASKEEMAACIIESLFNRIYGITVKPVKHMILPELIERETVTIIEG